MLNGRLDVLQVPGVEAPRARQHLVTSHFRLLVDLISNDVCLLQLWLKHFHGASTMFVLKVTLIEPFQSPSASLLIHHAQF